MINCVVIDDELHAVNLITEYIEKTPFLNLLYSTTNSIDGHNFIRIQKNSINLIFLDIEMENLTGTSLLKLIPENIPTVFTTAYDQYALEAFGLGAKDYLLKPILYDSFLRTINRIFDNGLVFDKDEPYLTISGEVRNSIKKIYLKDVYYFEAKLNSSIIHCTDSAHTVDIGLKELETKIDNSFIRVHKSYIVSKRYIDRYENNYIFLNNDQHIPLGITFRDNVLDYLLKHKI